MSVHYRSANGMIIIFGNTYPHRERIKALGARYNGPDKVWRLPISEANLQRVQDLCEAAGGGLLEGLENDKPMTSEEKANPADSGLMQVPPPSLQHAKPDSQSLTVSEFLTKAAYAIQDAFPQSVWIVGEVQNFSLKASGLYFDLAEGRKDGHHNATLTVRAILWSRTARELTHKHAPLKLQDILQDGMQIRVLCSVQLYRDRGSLSLIVEDIDPSFTRGALAMAREKLLKELRAKGLDQANKKLVMPKFPFKVGLISASGSRAQSDFLDQLFQGAFPGEVLFCPTPMQGEEVPLRVKTAITLLQEKACDLIVITRGGGSAADLRWFDAAEIAYAIAGSRVPLIAAIGHHDDICVAEEVCFLRQKTPTAAADMILEIFRATRESIDRFSKDFAQALDRKLGFAQEMQAALAERLILSFQSFMTRQQEIVFRQKVELEKVAEQNLVRMSQNLATKLNALEFSASNQFHKAEGYLKEHLTRVQHGFQSQMQSYEKNLYLMTSRIEQNIQENLSKANSQLSSLETAIVGLNPKPWLEKGWTQLSGQKGLIRNKDDIHLGDLIKARLNDALLELRIESITPREKEQIHE